MSKMIQVRNVPDQLHRTLKVRAAAEGLSLSDFIKRELELIAARPALEEVDAEVQARWEQIIARRGGPIPTETIVDAVRSGRDA